MELDLLALVVGAVLGALAGATAGILLMFMKVVAPVNDLLLEVDKVMNKVRGAAGGGGGGGLMGLVQGVLPFLAGKAGLK